MNRENYVVFKYGGEKMRIFLESEEYWFEDFKVDNLRQAISELKALYRDCKECFKEDGVVRKIGLIIE
jgi:1,4-alpha-glucan branching enzyme